MVPWRSWLAQCGFTWQSCHPVLFASLNGACSTFHTDNSSSLFIQVAGTKSFHYMADGGFNKIGNLPRESPTSRTIERMSVAILRPADLFGIRCVCLTGLSQRDSFRYLSPFFALDYGAGKL